MLHESWRPNLFLSSAQKTARVIGLWLLLCLSLSACQNMTKLLTSTASSAPVPAAGVAIIVSDSSPAFTGVQRELARKFSQPVSVYVLSDESANASVRKKIAASPKTTIVAIGLPAARLARSLTNKKVIFCQVFNYEEAGLVTPWMKGVAATVPMREQFRVWKTLYPNLSRVGAITGNNLQGLMKEAQEAADANQIQLVHVVVKSDKETLYAYKKLTPKVQGMWLVPDNRVLSHGVIRDVMAHSVKQGMPVAVFGGELLGLGGLISLETSHADIADQVMARVRQAQDATGVPGSSVMPLTKATIRINTVMAQRLNLKIPESLLGMAYAP
jgi:ABC-type uncharacterized transport system substrate-binding protein